MTFSRAADACLATLSGAGQESSRRQYGKILRGIVAEFGADTAPGEIARG